MILQHLNTILAFTMIMMLLSLLITAVVQLVVAVCGLRGRNLLWGVTQLLKEIDPELEDHAPGLARQVLNQPVLSTSTNRLLQLVDWCVEKAGKEPWFNRGKRPPTAIGTKELLLVLDRLRTGELDEKIKTKLDSLFDNLVTAPAADLPGADQLAAKLRERLEGRAEELAAETLGEAEKKLPGTLEIAASLKEELGDEAEQRIAEALREVGKNLPTPQELAATLKKRLGEEVEELTAKTLGQVRKVDLELRNWFDVVMDATTEKFKLWTRWITVAGAAVLAFGFQVDSIEILHDLSTDPALREAVLNQVEDVDALYEAVKEQAGKATAAAGNGDAAEQRFRQAREAVDLVLEEVYETRILDFEAVDSIEDLGQDFPGKLMTLLLLSLGAPFWYKVLRNVLALRSIVAQRQDRQTSGAAA